jgi:rhomboid protease GluP
MDAVGLNGTRLRWKWNQKRSRLGEAGLRGEMMVRSARGRHKMCPSCRALVPRSARKCPECGAELASVGAPGIGRLVSNVLPGATAATSLLLLVNGFWFVLMVMAQIRGGSGGGGGSIFGGFDLDLMIRFGSGLSRYVPQFGTGGEWWRLVTPIFLHGGLIHFFFNSYVLLRLGPLVEEIFGTGRFWVVYLLSGLAGNALSQLPRLTNTVGASGAILGLIGLLMVFGWTRGGPMGDRIKRQMIQFAIFIAIFGLVVPGIDNWNHLGGFICGALMGLVTPTGPYRGKAESAFWQIASLAGVLLVVFAFYKVALSAI